MKLATLLMIVLSNQGYWFAGQSGTITLRPAVRAELPAADLIWELRLEGIVLEKGRTAIDGNDKPTEIALRVPSARVRLFLHWRYRLVDHVAGKELDAGDVPISIFPDDLLNGLASRVGRSKLVVWDKPDGLPKALDLAKVPYSRVSAAGNLQFSTADFIIVGQDILTDSPFEQSSMPDLAQNGASVMIFRQSQPGRLIGYPLIRRDAPAALDWRTDHPLLAGLEPQDLRSWIAAVTLLQAVQLPADEPALAISSYPREIAGDHPAPIDAILLTRSIGKGRIVLCQIPFGDWTKDPRSQIMLANAIDYLLTRPQPTPRPSERPGTQPAPTKSTLDNQIFPGDKP